MSIKIKISKKPVNFIRAIKVLENRLLKIKDNKASEMIWILEHPETYTAGTNFKNSEILDKRIKLYKTNRGGKITYHGPGQIIFYFLINLNKRKKDIRWFVRVLENTIIETLKLYKINSIADRNNIGIWVKHNNRKKKVAAIGLKIKNWIAYHGFSLNYSVKLKNYKKIIPCGLVNKEMVNLTDLKKNQFKNIQINLVKKFIKNLET